MVILIFDGFNSGFATITGDVKSKHICLKVCLIYSCKCTVTLNSWPRLGLRLNIMKYEIIHLDHIAHHKIKCIFVRVRRHE